LRENNLEVIEDVVPISARLIVNKVSYKFKNNEIDAIVSEMAKQVENK
jgi:ATP phosphoribosyltransferase